METKIPARGKALVATDLSILIPEGTDFFVFVWVRVSKLLLVLIFGGFCFSAALLGIFGSSLKHWINVGAGVIDDDLRSSFLTLLPPLSLSELRSSIAYFY